MQKGLTKKYDYEKAKLKSKVVQPDYRERIAEEGDNFDRGGSQGNRITLRDVVRGGPAAQIILRDEKLKAVRFFEQWIRNSLLQVDEWRFKFKFTAADFAKENNLHLIQALRVLPGIRNKAEEHLRITKGRLVRAQLEGDPLRLIFKTSITTVEPVAWGQIYKRVLICPSEHENDT